MLNMADVKSGAVVRRLDNNEILTVRYVVREKEDGNKVCRFEKDYILTMCVYPGNWELMKAV